MSETDEVFSIGEASEKTDLPESTIRYYDREFSDYLSIQRGDNNERLFDEDSLKELEYIRYLIKRESLSVDEVKERLEKEEEYMEQRGNEQKTQSAGVQNEPTDETSAEDGESFASYEQSDDTDDAIDKESLLKSIRQIEDRMESLEQNQQKILELLDMNLQRYNKLVEDL